MKRIARYSLVLVFAMATAACVGPNLPDVDCTDVPNFKNVKAFDVCTDCHSSKLEGIERRGAPVGIDYNDYDSAKANAEHGVAEVHAGSMPPGQPLKADDQEAFYKWGLCGTPE